MKTKKQTGFTIIELIIVIVVIGILAVITVTVFGGVKRRAEVAKADSSAHYVLKVLQAYREQNGHFPHGSAASGSTCLSEEACALLGETYVIDSELETQFSTLMGNYYTNIHGSKVAFTTSGRGGEISGEYDGLAYTYEDSPDASMPNGTFRLVRIIYTIPDANYTCPGQDFSSVNIDSGSAGHNQLVNGEYLGPMSYGEPIGGSAKYCIIQFYEAA